MISVSAAFAAAIARDQVQLAELFDLALETGEHFRYTTHDVDIVWDAGGNTYSAAMPLTRNDAGYYSDGQIDDVEVYLANIDGDLADRVFAGTIDQATMTCKRVRWDATYAADEEITVFSGPVNLRYNRQALIITVRPSINSLNIQVPRHTWQDNCNYGLFDTGCDLVRADYKYEGTTDAGTAISFSDAVAGTVYKVAFDNGDEDNPIEPGDSLTGSDGTPGDGVCVGIAYVTSSTGYLYFVENSHAYVDNETITGGGNTVQVDGAQAEDTTFYEMGEVKITSGPNSGLRRQIYSCAGNQRTLNWALPSKLVGGITYEIYPGCDGQSTTCRQRFGNITQFRGFPYIPKIEDVT